MANDGKTGSDKPVKIGKGGDSTSAQASLDKYEFEADQRKGK